METMTLKTMKGSDVHRIIAAVLDIMEKVNVPNMADAKLQPEKENGNLWKMEFQKKETNFDELNTIKNELGKNFFVKISVTGKNLLISVIATSDDFVSLIQKKGNEQIPTQHVRQYEHIERTL